MEKVIRDGKVAVAVAKGYGCGWSTSNDVSPMDARYNLLFLERRFEEIQRLCEEEGLNPADGIYQVKIKWVPVGSRFIIQEYDGSEEIAFFEDFKWLEA